MIFIRITARIGADGNTKTNGSNVSMIFDVNRSRRTVTANGCCRAEGFAFTDALPEIVIVALPEALRP